MANLFEGSLVIYRGEENISAALREAGALWEASENQAYLGVSEEAAVHCLRTALDNLDENGMASLLREVDMPADAREELVHNPGHAIVAACIDLINRDANAFEADTSSKLKTLMGSLYRKGIFVHGMEAAPQLQRTMKMLGLAGAKRFLEQQPDFSSEFSQSMAALLSEYCNYASESTPNGKPYYESPFQTEPNNEAAWEVLACWDENPIPVFVYGTLMKGQRAHDLLWGSSFCGHFCLDNYAMYDLGEYPGIRAKKDASVVGEVYYVSAAMLKRMDGYEGKLYTRKHLRVRNAFGSVNAQVYVYNFDVCDHACPFPWNSAEDTYLWYAAYGSNMNALRFSYYILGGLCSYNGQPYDGCRDKRLWTHSFFADTPGRMYFGNHSKTWCGHGVAFLDTSKRKRRSIVRLYRITQSQLLDIQKREGNYPHWYGRIACLGIAKNGEPIYTLTADILPDENAPSKAYLTPIRDALVNEASMDTDQAEAYLSQCGAS